MDIIFMALSFLGAVGSVVLNWKQYKAERAALRELENEA